MINVLFVCMGNICRSPMAEGIFRHLVEQARLEEYITCDSAGTENYHIGDLPDPRMRRIAKAHGIELTHCARQLHKNDFDRFDYIIAMDESNLSHIMAHNSYKNAYSNKVFLMRVHDEQQNVMSVPDPYYGQIEGFEEVYQILWSANNRFLKYLVEKHQLSFSC